MSAIYTGKGAQTPRAESLPSWLFRLAGNPQGSSAIEFALIGSIFVVLLLNVVDFARLIWSSMQLDYAAAAGAQAAYNTCASGRIPVTPHCLPLTSVVTTAAQSTSLGADVSLATGSPSEAYYCISGATLQPAQDYPYLSPPIPFNCSNFGQPSVAPGDYITVNVNYAFTPLFSGLSLARTQTLQAMGMQRLQ